MQIKIVHNVLTDKSKTYDVLLIKDDQVVRLPAYDQACARHLRDVIAKVVEDDTVELVV